MASLWKHPESKYWTACFTDHTGKQRKKSTKETDRRKAQKLADHFESAYRAKLTEAKARQILSDAYTEIHGERILSKTVRKHVDDWLLKKDVETSSATIASYKGACFKFVDFLGDRANADLAFVTMNDIQRFRDYYARKLTPKSVNNQLKIIRVLFQDALRSGLVVNNVASLVPVVKERDSGSSRRSFTIKELKLVLGHADEEWRGIILMGLYTGQRIGDIVRLTWNAIDFQGEELRFETRKTKRQMIIPIATPLMDYLLKSDSADNPNDPIFPKAYELISRTRQSGRLSKQFYRIMVSAGLAEPRTHQKAIDGEGRDGKRRQSELSFHCLRHTATSLLKAAGASEAVAMDIIGHDSKEISRNYTHIEESAKRQALNNLPTII